MEAKKIKVSQLRVGMFLLRFEADWMATPFWRNEFLLTDDGDLRQALGSGLDECWIDPARGLDVPGVAAARDAPAMPALLHAAAPRATPRTPLPATPTTLAAELEHARSICAGAKLTIAATFEQHRMGRAGDHAACEAVVDDIVASVARHPHALLSLARLKSGDDYTYLHSVAVCALMVALAQAMQLPAATVREAGLGGLLHDMGKAAIESAILNKPGALDDSEFAAVKRHPQHGYEALAGGPASEAVREVVLYHHERMDGRGYPHGRAGDAIPLLARMGAVCDVYDAITSDRPYKKGWDPAEALGKMISWTGHFDPAVLSAFVGVVGIYPVGALVRLKSGRLAVVVEQNRQHLTRPVVRVFYCMQARKCLAPALLDLAAEPEEAILGPEARDRWPARVLDAMWGGKQQAA